MDFAAKFEQGLSYGEFLATHGAEEHRRRWADLYAQVKLTAAQAALLGSFTREMKVLCLAGAWCGDCVNQCPIFEHFAAASETIKLRFLDRDAHADVQAALKLCGGNRVPVLVFLNEDGQHCGVYGDRTLAKYRRMAADQIGPSCPTGIGVDLPLLQAVTQDWLNEFERIHLMLRLSPRLRERHGD